VLNNADGSTRIRAPSHAAAPPSRAASTCVGRPTDARPSTAPAPQTPANSSVVEYLSAAYRRVSTTSFDQIRFTAGVTVASELDVLGHAGLPWSGVRASRYPMHSGSRPTYVALGHERRAPVPKHHLPVLGLCLRPHWMQPSLLVSISLIFLLVRVQSSEVRGALCGRSVRDCRVTASAAVRHIVGGNPRTHTHTHTHTSHSGVNAPSASRALIENMGQFLRNRQP
jgi:hypothetical protein